MTKRILLFAAMLLTSIATWATTTLPTTYWTDNTEPLPAAIDDVITITTEGQLAALAKSIEDGGAMSYNRATIQLAANLDLSAHLWTPIGLDYGRPFTGNFDGKGYTITGLTINAPSSDYQGLFGWTRVSFGGYTIKNVGLINTNIIGGDDIGALVGYNEYKISNCYNTGSVTGNNDVGGLVGSHNPRIGSYAITNCYNTATVTATRSFSPTSAGIVASTGATITHCYYLQGCAPQGIGGKVDAIDVVESRTEAEMKLVDFAAELNANRGDGTTWVPVANGYPTFGQAYTLSFNTNGGTGTVNPIIAYVGMPIGTLPITPTKEGYNLVGWEIEGTEITAETVWAYTSNQTATAIWSPNWSGHTQPLPDMADGVITIASEEQLAQLAKNVNSGRSYKDTTFVLARSLNLSAYLWVPIGRSGNTFGGTFDGGGHTISGITLNNPNASYQGLFGYVANGAIKNVGVVNSNIIGNLYIAGIAGSSFASTITNCYNTSSVAGNLFIGGIVGDNSSTTLHNCYNTGAVTSTRIGAIVGGIVGRVDFEGVVENCYNTGTITGKEYSDNNVGGIVGSVGIANGIVSRVYNCYNTGIVIATGENSYAGAIVGYNAGRIVNGYYLQGTATTGVGNNSDTSDGRKSHNIQANTSEEIDTKALLIRLNQNRAHYKPWVVNEGGITFADAESYTLTLDLADGTSAPTTTTVYKDYAINLPLTRPTRAGYTFVKWTIDQTTITAATKWNYTTNKTAVAVWVENSYWGNHTQPLPDIVDGTITITTAGQLAQLAQNVNNGNTYSGVTILLANNLDLSTHLWTPIGTEEHPFVGVLDGRGYTINGVIINSSTNHQGLLGRIESGGVIKNLGVINSHITGRYATGGIVGINLFGTITNCYYTGMITASNFYIGGIVGENHGTVTNCYNTSLVVGNRNNAGGIAGVNHGTISNCYNTGTVVANLDPGSIDMGASFVINSTVGGIAGYNGVSIGDAYLTNCYNVGEVVGRLQHVGSIVGNNSDVINHYYSLQATAIKSVGNWGVTTSDRKTDTEMKAAEFVTLLNNHRGDHAEWIAVSNGYPTFKTYTLHLDANGSTDIATSATVYPGQSIGKLPTVSRAGYTFVGWVIENSIDTITATTVWNYAEDKTAVAQWSANSYTISFDANGGEGTMEPQTVTYGTTIDSLPANPTRIGYTFKEWAIDGEVITATTVWNYTEDKTAVAQWSVNSYTISFDANGGEGTMEPQAFTYGVAQNLVANNFSRVGYTFVGWAHTASATEAALMDMASYQAEQNSTLYAVWEKSAATSVTNPSSPSLVTYAQGNYVVIKGATMGDAVTIYSTSGSVLYQGTISATLEQIPLQATGVFIVRVGNTVAKVVKQ